MYGRIVYNTPRPSDELLKGFEGVLAGVAADAMERFQGMDHTIRPLYDGIKLVGSALTVQCFPGDNITVHKAMQMAQPGDVLVIDAAGALHVSIMGGNMAVRASQKGVRGWVTNGSIRDVNDIKRGRFPVFCYGVTPRAPQKNTPGSVNMSIQVGGVVVHPGDIIIGDDDGVTVVPLALAEEILVKVKAKMKAEFQQQADVDAGKNPLDTYLGSSWVDDILKGKITEVGREGS